MKKLSISAISNWLAPMKSSSFDGYNFDMIAQLCGELVQFLPKERQKEIFKGLGLVVNVHVTDLCGKTESRDFVQHPSDFPSVIPLAKDIQDMWLMNYEKVFIRSNDQNCCYWCIDYITENTHWGRKFYKFIGTLAAIQILITKNIKIPMGGYVTENEYKFSSKILPYMSQIMNEN